MSQLIVTMGEGKRVDAHLKGHIIHTDQPVASGGDDSAPAPFDLFLASLGTCAGIYVKMFCEQRGIPTDGIQIVQTMQYDPARKGIGHIELDIQLPDGFPEKYKQAVISSAELCAVKRHLENPPSFTTRTSVVQP